MEKPHAVSVAALVVALVALLASVGGVAEAAKHKIGKNLVVTKSIKNGAVTGKKVKDGSLTVADLAPGTVPPGTTLGMAACTVCPFLNAPNAVTGMAPFGRTTDGVGVSYVVPVSVRVSDFQVLANTQDPGKSFSVGFRAAPPGQPAQTVLSCTIPAGASECRDAGPPVTIPAGSSIVLILTNGPGGSNGSVTYVSYTMRA